MATPIRWGMKLPDGTPLRYGMPGLRWNGTLEEVIAAMAQQQNKTMSNQNKVSAALAAQALTNILAAYATIKTNLPFLISLSDDERAHLPHIGDKSAEVLNQTLLFVSQFPEALPATFDIAEFQKDGALFTPFETVVMASAENNQLISDTGLALRSDLLLAILDVYAFAKANNRNGAYDSYVNYMKGHFAKPRIAKAAAAKLANP
jgi:hypothetical protein